MIDSSVLFYADKIGELTEKLTHEYNSQMSARLDTIDNQRVIMAIHKLLAAQALLIVAAGARA